MTELDRQMDGMLLEIRYLKSDKYVNGIKADAVIEFLRQVKETGELSGHDYKFLMSFLVELRDNK